MQVVSGRRAFETLIDFFHDRLARHPGMHVYHYGAYERTAIKQLMSVYATREDQVDALLRREVFVNLHTVVRQALRAGVPSYSLKEVEALADFARQADVASGTRAGLEYERWMDTGEAPRLEAIRADNEEDCRATSALRDWLLRQTLVEGAETGSPRWLAGELLEYHRREARPAWWWFFARRDQMSVVDELVDDSEAIGRLEPDGSRPRAVRQSLEHRLRFPEQQHKLGREDQPVDPVTKAGAGTIVEVDDAAGIVVLRRGPSHGGVPPPKALIPGGPFRTDAQRAALGRLAASVRDADDRYRALKDVLARARPRLAGGARAAIQTTDLGEQRGLVASLDASYLFIQGPPGTGKTWTGARIVVDLIRRGRRVGVAATSHKAIHNLLDAIEEAAKEEGVRFRGLKKSSAGGGETEYSGKFITSAEKIDAFASASSGLRLFAGTAWLFAHEDLDGGGPGGPLVDTLVIDEAGQVAIADALAMGRRPGTWSCSATRSSSPRSRRGRIRRAPNCPCSSTYWAIIRPPRSTWACSWNGRGGCTPTSAASCPRSSMAGGSTVSRASSASPPRSGRGCAGCRSITWATGRRRRRRRRGWRRRSAAWSARRGRTRTARPRLRPEDFMVVAPYNAQVRRLRAALAAAGLDGVPVGTVDKFQGRQAPVVFYSMASSSAETVPRSLEFLFSRNRLNVAVSRAQCLAHVVASPRLLESRARPIEQMRLINALCRFVEMADMRTNV